MKEWTQAAIQWYIDEAVEENLELDYKAADAFSKKPSKKVEITKDVSAMANSAGGIIVYGLAEHQDPNMKHCAEKIDPVDRREFSKEWLEHVINNIRPRIDGLIIHPVSVDTGPNDVVYVVEIPQSTTAHQARDYRYYKRFNFESVPMEDYEVRDVMHRATTPDVAVEFGYETLERRSDLHRYKLTVTIQNLGNQVVEHLKLQFTFPHTIEVPELVINEAVAGGTHLSARVFAEKDHHGDYLITYWYPGVFFPKEERAIGDEISLEYHLGSRGRSALAIFDLISGSTLNWTLYADDMTPRQGEVPFSKLSQY